MKVFIKADNKLDESTCEMFFREAGYDVIPNSNAAEVIVFSSTGRLDSKIYGVLDENRNNVSKGETMRTMVELLTFSTNCGDKKFIGFDKSALLLAKLSNAEIIHHVYDHYNNHFIRFNDANNSQIMVESRHSQMIYPYRMDPTEYDVIATTNPSVSSGRYRRDAKLNDFIPKAHPFREPEIVYFPRTKALCIMPRAFASVSKVNKEFIKSTIRDYLK